MTAHQSSALPAAIPASRQPADRLHRHPINGARKTGDPFIDLVFRRRFAGHAEFQRLSHDFGRSIAPATTERPRNDEQPLDYLFLTDRDDCSPDQTFDRLRWGGQLILVSRDREKLETVAGQYRTWRLDSSDSGAAAERKTGAWDVEPLSKERKYLFNLPLLGWRTPIHVLIARKTMLVPPGKSSDRFTYHVHLEKAGRGHYEVVKEIPTLERVLARLREKFPDADEDTLRRRARKFTDKIFPVFLTRETAMLKLLQRDLPKRFRKRVPHVISAETDSNGYTRLLRMNWLRNSRQTGDHAAKGDGHPPHPTHASHAPHSHPLTQLEFARQAADLLTALHDNAGIMHLDLRLDNIVITEQGVGFVDFGSAVRVGEEFPDASLLSNLFEEMMRTSQIQRMLGKMTERGQVTSEEICGSYQRIDKAVDFFYLAVQINNPLANPDFQGLVECDPSSDQAKAIAQLTDRILRPENPQAPEFSSARDILKGVEKIGPS